MYSIEVHDKIVELVNKFDNGVERYNRSPLFNQVINSLARDADPLKIIDQLINVAEQSQNALEDHLIHQNDADNHRKWFGG